MSSPGDKRKRGFCGFAKRVKRIFPRRKSAPLTLSGSTSPGAGIATVALALPQPESRLLDGVRDASDPLHASPPSANAFTSPATEMRILGRNAPDMVPVTELPAVTKVEVPEDALPPEVTITALQGAPQNAHQVLSDTDRTLERYNKAIVRIKKTLQLRRDEWEQFELSGFDSISLGEQDLKALQFQIDRVLDSRMKTSQTRTKRRKSKDLVEQCFTALAPFMKNVLSVAMSAAQVQHLTGI